MSCHASLEKDLQEVIDSYHLLSYSTQNNGPSKVFIF